MRRIHHAPFSSWWKTQLLLLIGSLAVSSTTDAFLYPPIPRSLRIPSPLPSLSRRISQGQTSETTDPTTPEGVPPNESSCESPLTFSGKSFPKEDEEEEKWKQLPKSEKPSMFVGLTQEQSNQMVSNYVEQLEEVTNDCVLCDRDQTIDETQQSYVLPGAREVDDLISRPIVELSLGLLVLLSCLVVALSTLSDLDPATYSALSKSQDILTYIFCIEFSLRWYAKFQEGIKYFAQPLVIVDVLANIVPLFEDSAAELINLRLLRIIRFSRILDDVDTFVNFQRGLGLREDWIRVFKPWQLQLARVFLSLLTLLSVATACIYAAEHEQNPAFTDYFTALYFGMTTLFTVGYGDIVPITTEGRLVVAASIVAGVAVVPAQAASLLEALLAAQNDQKAAATAATVAFQNENDPTSRRPDAGMLDVLTPCPSCGATMHWSDANYCWMCGGKLKT